METNQPECNCKPSEKIKTSTIPASKSAKILDKAKEIGIIETKIGNENSMSSSTCCDFSEKRLTAKEMIKANNAKIRQLHQANADILLKNDPNVEWWYTLIEIETTVNALINEPNNKKPR